MMMDNVMIDLETLGTQADAVILSIGAVKFDVDGSPLGERFYVTVDIDDQLKLGRTVTGSTIKWWMEQHADAKEVFTTDHEVSLRDALVLLSHFFDHDDYKVWGNGATFDNAILINAYAQVGLPQPWSYSNDRCYRTLKNLYPAIKKEDSWPRVEHNALDDAMSQALHCQALLAPPGSEDSELPLTPLHPDYALAMQALADIDVI